MEVCVSGSRSNRGFTLLEILVALVLLATAVSIILQLFSANLRSLAISEEYVTAAAIADVKLREISDNDDLEPGTLSEIIQDTYRADIAITETLQARTEQIPFRLLEVSLTLRWVVGGKERAFSLQTLKAVAKTIS